MIYFYILLIDGSPSVIKQNRVGLHGKQFNMYKFRTMKTDSHHLRDELKKKNEIKPWETLIVSDNLSWQKFSKINNHLYDLNGVKPVISISRNYPFKENFTHLIGYVSQANQDDIESTQAIKRNFA